MTEQEEHTILVNYLAARIPGHLPLRGAIACAFDMAQQQITITYSNEYKRYGVKTVTHGPNYKLSAWDKIKRRFRR